MRYKNSLKFKGGLLRSVALHALILSAVLVNVTFKNPEARKLTLPMQAQAEPFIEAVAITEAQLQNELDRLNKIEQDKLAEQRRILAEKERIKREQEAEKQRLAALKKQEEAAEKARQQRLVDEAAEKLRQQELAKNQAAEKALQQRLAQEQAALESRQALAAQQAAEEAAIQAALEAERQVLLAAQQAEQNAITLREVDRYKLMVQQAIMRHWLIQGAPDPNATTRLSVRLSPNGTVLKVELKSSSGNVAQDRSAIAAVYKASPLPVPEDPDVFKSFRELTLILRPDSIISER